MTDATATTKYWLSLIWFALCPAFVALVARDIYERAVLDLRELWPWLQHRPLLMFAAGAVYLGAHLWCLAWYLLAVRHTQRPIPALSDVVAECRPHAGMVALLAIALVVEYSPTMIWRWLLRL
ncbi:MAG TPA: hypothetical protein VH458_02040 [Vicinamibacterales bacterium]|jgi:hypothetical protein